HKVPTTRPAEKPYLSGPGATHHVLITGRHGERRIGLNLSLVVSPHEFCYSHSFPCCFC
ncbi:hypothetical protein FRC08_018347, partial [Ceratobasidium sp. 394]